MVDIGNVPVMNVLSNATNVIAEGEVFQLMNCKNPDVTEAAYFEVIKNKTAMLFEAASHSAALLAQRGLASVRRRVQRAALARTGRRAVPARVARVAAEPWSAGGGDHDDSLDGPCQP